MFVPPLNLSGFEGGQGVSLDLCDAESARGRLLCVSHVQGEAVF